MKFEVVVDLGKQERGLVGSHLGGRGGGEGVDDLLVALELVVDIVVSAEQLLVVVELEELQVLAPEFVGVVLGLLDPLVDFCADELVAVVEEAVLLVLDADALLEVVQLLAQQGASLLGGSQHFDLHLEALQTLSLR